MAIFNLDLLLNITSLFPKLYKPEKISQINSGLTIKGTPTPKVLYTRSNGYSMFGGEGTAHRHPALVALILKTKSFW